MITELDGMWRISRRLRFEVWPAILLASLALAGCSTPKPAPAPAPPAPYVRIRNTGSNVVQLQIAARKFVPARHSGPAVWLTGVSHIGESNYFAALQTHLDAQRVVLFEGVGEHPAAGSGANADDNAIPAPSQQSSLQSSMAASLGLVFQLDSINYRNPRFHHSDLSIEELRKVFANQHPAEGKAAAGESFEGLLQAMEGDSWLETLVQLGLRFISASPKLRGLSRLALIDAIAQLQGDPAQLRGLPPSFKQLIEGLIQERNQRVMRDLRSELARAGRDSSLSVFYGAGHMPDLERRLRQELDYHRAGELWLTAFSVDLAQAGISTSERDFIHDLIRREFEQLK